MRPQMPGVGDGTGSRPRRSGVNNPKSMQKAEYNSGGTDESPWLINLLIHSSLSFTNALVCILGSHMRGSSSNTGLGLKGAVQSAIARSERPSTTGSGASRAGFSPGSKPVRY